MTTVKGIRIEHPVTKNGHFFHHFPNRNKFLIDPCPKCGLSLWEIPGGCDDHIIPDAHGMEKAVFVYTYEGFKKYMCEHRLKALYRKGFRIFKVFADRKNVRIGRSGAQFITMPNECTYQRIGTRRAIKEYLS